MAEPIEDGNERPRVAHLPLLVLSLWNGAGQVVPAIVALLLTPLIVREVGLDAYGVITLVLTLVTVCSSLDGGMAQSLTRFYILDPAGASSGRLTRSALVFVLGLGVVVAAAAAVARPLLLGFANLTAGLQDDAARALGWLPVLVGLVLLAGVPAAILQAHGRFKAISAVSSAASLVYAGSVVLALSASASVSSVLAATAVRLLFSAALLFGIARSHLDGWRPWLVSRSEARTIATYSTRVQASVLLSLVNSHVDVLILTAVAPIRAVGLYAIGFQVAWTLRSVCLWSMAPIGTLLSAAFARGGVPEARRCYAELQASWHRAVVPLAFVGAPGVGILIPIWFGRDFVPAGIVASLLALGYAVNLTTAPATNYVRAIGRPAIESRYALVSVVLNVILTALLAVPFELYGVVGATAAATIIGTFAFPVFGRRAGCPELGGMTRDAPWVLIVALTLLTAALFGIALSFQPGGAGGVLLILLVGAAIGAGYLLVLNDWQRRRTASVRAR